MYLSGVLKRNKDERLQAMAAAQNAKQWWNGTDGGDCCEGTV